MLCSLPGAVISLGTLLLFHVQFGDAALASIILLILQSTAFVVTSYRASAWIDLDEKS